MSFPRSRIPDKVLGARGLLGRWSQEAGVRVLRVEIEQQGLTYPGNSTKYAEHTSEVHVQRAGAQNFDPPLPLPIMSITCRNPSPHTLHFPYLLSCSSVQAKAILWCQRRLRAERGKLCGVCVCVWMGGVCQCRGSLSLHSAIQPTLL